MVVILLPLSVSLLVSTLRLDIRPAAITAFDTMNVPDSDPESASETSTPENRIILRLLSANRNLTFAEQNGMLFADSLQITSLNGKTAKLELQCLNDVLLSITVENASKSLLSPSLCQRDNSQLSEFTGYLIIT
ncbi:unnamed protein product [Gongylonema pulchrum]|uniref:Cadherin domain-containing protein n=1 Tax=Gongylonema pulchrum TaxID=637853 RepID=A0A183EU38_9BILA|nr:unnamed protein product [Gongylonema pulchrum]